MKVQQYSGLGPGLLAWLGSFLTRAWCCDTLACSGSTGHHEILLLLSKTAASPMVPKMHHGTYCPAMEGDGLCELLDVMAWTQQLPGCLDPQFCLWVLAGWQQEAPHWNRGLR